MILDSPRLDALRAFGGDVCIIGSGPAGTVTGLALADRGFRVLLLESGGRRSEPAFADLAKAENLTPGSNFEPHTAVGRQLGGTSNLWAGRCLPFDPIDFRARPWLDLQGWPISEADLAPYLARALEYLGAGPPVFYEALSGVDADPAFGFETLERWTNVPQIHRLHRATLTARRDLLVALCSTATGFRYDAEGRITDVEVHVEGEGRGLVPAPRVILAGGGNESTRLLLLEQRLRPALFGGPDGPLGRFYMGHVFGQIADVVFCSQALHDGLDYHVDAHGVYVRRRLVPSEAAQQSASLSNVAFWPVVPNVANPAHRSGPLSAVFLALSFGPLGRRLIAEPVRLKHVGAPPYRRLAHVRNVVCDLGRTVGFAPAFLWKHKIAGARLPGFFLRNPARRYGLEYHAEHLPNPDSRLSLGTLEDRLGQPRLRIALRFSEADARTVVRAHDELDAWLVRNRLARLFYHHSDLVVRLAAVLEAAKDGAHQIGTIRMGREPGTAVVDAQCRAFDVPNLYVVSTAVLPTSGQANPTLTAVQLGLRLVDQLAVQR
jgi:GMC oxidoreductase/FAD binding domain